MRLVFHIGMGKTGTTSIQHALASNAGLLQDAGVHYLGPWFEDGAPGKAPWRSVDRIAHAAPAQQNADAARFLASTRKTAAETGASLLIHSNEMLFERGAMMAPFLQGVAAHADTQFLCYLRAPQRWLPSAFLQWNVRHKTRPGPLPTFRERAPELLAMYRHIRWWAETFGDRLTVRAYPEGGDVVADFCAALGLPTLPPTPRLLEQGPPAETVLRALFASLHEGEVRPDAFNRATDLREGRRRSPSLDEAVDLCFAHEGLDEVIGEERDLFAFIAERFGLEFTAVDGGAATRPPPDKARVREDALTLLAELVLRQSRRVSALEARLAALEARGG